MIYPDYLESELKRYCEINNIPLHEGNVPALFVPQVQAFMNHKIRNDRARTRAQEEINKYAISPLLQALIANRVESPIEEYLYLAFVQNGIDKHCKPQFEIGTKRVDFAFPVAKLVVECDGKEYHYANVEQMERDQKRDQYLAKKGWRIIHLEGLVIRRNIKLCIDRINEQLQPFLRMA